MGLKCSSTARALAQHAQGPGFEPQPLTHSHPTLFSQTYSLRIVSSHVALEASVMRQLIPLEFDQYFGY